MPPAPVVGRSSSHALPGGYKLTETAEFAGYFVMHAQVFEQAL